MSGLTISPPGVEVIQEFTSTSPTVSQPALPTVLVGPCFQIVSAFDDTGEPVAEALAGTYRDGQGRISYNLPSLLAQAVLTGFEEDIRVFLVYGGGTSRELNSVYDEDVIVDDSSADYTASGRTWVDADGLFTQIGVEAGDVVRFTYRGELIDVPVESVTSDTILVLDAGLAPTENLSSVTYDLVKNPAEFVFNATQQASYRYGDKADYILFSATTLKTDGLTTADYVGSLGDDLNLVITDSEHFLDGTDGATGGGIFTSAGATFTSSVGSVGTVTGKRILVGAPGSGAVLREVLTVVSATMLTIESGLAAGLSSQTYHVGPRVASGTNGVTSGGGTTFTSAGATFLSSIPNTGGTPDANTYIEIGTDGTYLIDSVDSDTQLTLNSAATNGLTAQTFEIMQQSATASDGATGALTTFVSVSKDFTTLSSPTTKSVNITAGAAAKAISSVDNAHQVTLSSGFASGGSALQFSVVETAATLSLSYDAPNKKVIIRCKRTAGITGSTYAQIRTALTSNVDASYNSIVSDLLTASLGGTTGTGAVTIDESQLPIDVNLDGGSDAEDLLLDADLIASATPTAQVYVSYKALRVDVSDQATSPTLLEISSQDDRESQLGEASTDNPLSLAAFFALQNSPTRSLKVLGVSAVSATKPNGTVEAYTSAFDFLSGYDVYHIVPLTMDPVVGQAAQAHVDALSAPSQKSERVAIVSSPLPDYENATVIASGTDGNTGTFTSDATAEFSASVDFDAAGVQAGDLLVVTALASSDDSPEAVNGTIGPVYGVLIDSIKSGDDFVLIIDGTATGIGSGWNNLVDVAFTVYRAGAAITAPVDQSEAIAQVSEGFADRRTVHHWPDEVTADVNGTASILDGFYAAAGWGGKMNIAPPQQPFSRTTISGFTGVHHSNGYFSKAHLDRMAGGGTWISIQEGQNAPLRCRHQLTTDTSSIERREFSITRIVDYVAKFLRAGVNKQVGNFNITQSYLDGLATTIQGLLRALIESSVITSGTLSSVEQDSVTPDKVNVVVAIDVPYPANTIEITIQV